MARTLRLGVFYLALLVTVPVAFAEDSPPVQVILDRMMAHNAWQDEQLREYRALRTFFAENPRFKMDATLLVETQYRQPDRIESKSVRFEGSALIRERVFDKILEAEDETRSTRAKKDVDITPENYRFRWIGVDTCDERACYHLGLSPKQKGKYAIDGEVWIDAEDFAIARIHGSPAKRPSFWTIRTEIDRRYKRNQGVWLTDRIESNSDIFIAGRSHLSINCDYKTIRLEGPGR